MSGYLLIPFLTLHILSHRIIPASPEAPINALSPAELGFGFVSYGLRAWPVVSWTTYAVLIGSGVWHALAGTPTVLNWLRSRRRLGTPPGTQSGRRIRLPAVFIALVSALGLGLARLHGEDPGFSRGMVGRVEAVYRSLPWLYR